MATIPIKLGARPKSFRRTVTLPLPEGGEGVFEVDFRYRTRREHAAFVDELIASSSALAKAAAEKVDGAAFSMVTVVDGAIKKNAADLMKVLDGWALDVPLTEEALDQLCDEFPTAAEVIMVRYRETLVEARSGN